ncbi:hypothetical protein ACFL10_00810 [Patescibacteria group bacterium]
MNPEVLKVADQTVLDLTNPEHLELAGISDATALTVFQIKQLLDGGQEGYDKAIDLTYDLASRERSLEITFASNFVDNLMDGEVIDPIIVDDIVLYQETSLNNGIIIFVGTKDRQRYKLVAKPNEQGDHTGCLELIDENDALTYHPYPINLLNAEACENVDFDTETINLLMAIRDPYTRYDGLSDVLLDVLYGKDPALGKLVEMNFELEGVLGEPFIIDGIIFFQVGWKSSNELYFGTKDGKRYEYNFGEDDDSTTPIEERVREIDDFDKYWEGC